MPDNAGKILIIGSLADSLIRFRGELIAEMRRSDYEVIVCAPDICPEHHSSLQKMGCQLRQIPLDRTGMSIFRDIATLFALWRLFRAERPDHVLAYTIKPVIYGGLAARAAGAGRFYRLDNRVRVRIPWDGPFI